MRKPNFHSWNRNDPEMVHKLVKRSGLNQVQAARAIGMEPRTLRLYLNGTRECPFHVGAMLYLLK